MTNYLFIDIDGTLVDNRIKRGSILDSAKLAISRAREKGNKVFVCTGRPLCLLSKTITDLNFDGYICSAGAYVKVGEEEIFKKPILKEDLKIVLDIMDSVDDAVYWLECLEKCYIDMEKCRHRIIERFGESFLDYGLFKHNVDTKKMLRDDVYKISYSSKILPPKELDKLIKDKFYVVDLSYDDRATRSGEISLIGIDKGLGVKKIVEYFNGSLENTYAFGDSENDKGMFDVCKHSIAMGNATEQMKKMAAFITKDINEDGLYYAFEHFDLI